MIDSGSPISLADPVVLRACGVEAAVAPPRMVLPLNLGTRSTAVTLFEVRVALVPPVNQAPPIVWTSLLGARPGAWQLPFSFLLGQRGWFDRFTTTISDSDVEVHLPEATGGGR
ncbi:MAG: hypothetical protein WD225_09385 [Ilumatobacteraceae bacterium]